MTGQQRATIRKPMREASGESNLADTLILDFWPPELWEINVCGLGSPVWGALLWIQHTICVIIPLSLPRLIFPTPSYSIFLWHHQVHYIFMVLVAQSCLTLCDPTDRRPPGSSVHGILQVRILKPVAIPFSRGSSRPKDQTWLSCIADRFFTVFWGMFFLTWSDSWGVISNC